MPCNNHTKQILWKARHFILSANDHINTRNSDQKVRNCTVCTTVPQPDATHLHTLATCAHSKHVWRLLDPVFDVIGCNSLPKDWHSYEKIFGTPVAGKKRTLCTGEIPLIRHIPDKPALHINAIVALTIKEIWLNRCRVLLDKKTTTPPIVITKRVITAYKDFLETAYLRSIRNGTEKDFKYNYQIETVFKIPPDPTNPILDFHI